SDDLTKAIKQFLDAVDSKPLGLALIGASERNDVVPQVAAIAGDVKEQVPLRLTAVQTLGMLKSKEATEVLVNDLLKTKPADVSLEAVLALGKQGTPESLGALKKLASDKENALALRQTAVAGLAGTRPGSIWLLDAHAKKDLADDLKGDLGRLLR